MIKYNNSNINDWYYGDSNIIKVYHNNAICYYKIITSGSTSGQTPCYAVVEDISQYSDTEFEDVFNKADGKWYKLNNLTQYEEYGVYGSGRTITYYEGKLTIDGDYEYQYSGGSWVNVGEVSGSTATLPDIDFSINYNAANYISTAYTIPQTEGQLQNVDAVCNYGYKIVDHSADGYISVTGNSRFVCTGNSGTYLNRSNTQANCPMTIVSKAKTTSGYSIFTNRTSSARQYMYRQDKTYAYLCGTGNTSLDSCICSDTVPSILSVRVYYDSGIKAKWNNWTTSASSTPEVYGYNNQNLTNGGALFCDYANRNSEFWQGDFYWIYMSQNALTDEQVQQVIDYNEGGTVEYPMYYDEIQDPPDNVSFSSMTEAEEYECPWVGMIATIDGVKYIFSGDSQSGYEWVAKPSRLPVGYTELQYIENESVAYINTSFKPNQDTRVIARMQTVTSMMHARFFGAGAWNGSNGYQFDYENYYNGQLHISWGAINGWSTYSYYGDYNAHTYDWNKNVFTIDNGVFSAETTYTSFQCTDNLGLFVHIYNGNPCGDVRPWTEGYERSFLHGRLYSCQIYDNGTLIRDLVPCTRDSDSKVGVYDIVNDVFYSSAYSGYEFTAGPAVN